MTDQSLFYKHFQKYLEFGYNVSDCFLKWCNAEDIYYGKTKSVFNPAIPLSTFIAEDERLRNIIEQFEIHYDYNGFMFFGDLTFDNIGTVKKDIENTLVDDEIKIIDSGCLLAVKFNDLKVIETSITGFYSEPEIKEFDYSYMYAFTLGYRMRLGILGDLICYNVLVDSGFRLFDKGSEIHRICVPNVNIICLRVIANYVYRWFLKRDITFDCQNHNIVPIYKGLEKLETSKVLKIQLIKYLSRYAVSMSLCTDDFLNFFYALQMIYYYAYLDKDYYTAKWAMEVMNHSPYIKYTGDYLEVLNRSISTIKENDFGKDLSGLWYLGQWQIFEYSLTNSKLKRYESVDEELILTTRLICSIDEESKMELQVMCDQLNDKNEAMLLLQ